MDVITKAFTEEDIAKKRQFRRNMINFLLLALPTVYCAIIGAVIVHEIIGHGLTAWLLGTDFVGFGILVDGMGWAAIDITKLPEYKQAMVLMAGALYTLVFSTIFLMLSIRFRRNYILTIVLLFFSFAFLMDGAPYFFWDAIYRGGIGDVSQLLTIYPNEGLRWLILLTMGVIGSIGIVLFNHLFLTRTINRFQATTLHQQIIIAAAVFLIQTLGWLSFDWQQLIPVPAMGMLPSALPILSSLIILIFLIGKRKKAAEVDDIQQPLRWKGSLIISWSVCSLVIGLILLWFQNGVIF